MRDRELRNRQRLEAKQAKLQRELEATERAIGAAKRREREAKRRDLSVRQRVLTRKSARISLRTRPRKKLRKRFTFFSDMLALMQWGSDGGRNVD